MFVFNTGKNIYINVLREAMKYENNERLVCVCLSTGVFGLTWFITWTFVGYEKPCKHPRISEEERLYIEDKINENTSVISNKVQTPLLHIQYQSVHLQSPSLHLR